MHIHNKNLIKRQLENVKFQANSAWHAKNQGDWGTIHNENNVIKRQELASAKKEVRQEGHLFGSENGVSDSVQDYVIAKPFYDTCSTPAA